MEPKPEPDELSKYRIARVEDRKRIQEVKNARISKTHFQSLQLSLFELDEGAWLLFLKLPDYAPRMRRTELHNIVQASLFPAEEAPSNAQNSKLMIN